MKTEQLTELETKLPPPMPPGVSPDYLKYNEKLATLKASLKYDKPGKPSDIDAAVEALEAERRRLLCTPTEPNVDFHSADVDRLFENVDPRDESFRAKVRDFCERMGIIYERHAKTMLDAYNTFTIGSEAWEAALNRAESAKRKGLAPLVREYQTLLAEHDRLFPNKKQVKK